MKTNSILKAFTLLLMSLVATTGQAQNDTGRKVFGKSIQSINPHNGLIKCISTEYEQSLQEKNPSRATTEAFEQWIAPKVAAIKNNMLTQKSVNTVISIPVVVHVIHNGDALGSNENISDARVISQITVLNQDFRRMLNTNGYNENPVGADMEVEFVLAKRKPDGTATTGIDRVNLNVASWATESSVETNLKPNTSWDPTQYFNIWVCAFSTSSSAELNGVLGYAQFPDSSGLGGLDAVGGAANTDGVIIDYRCFGSKAIANTGTYFTDYDQGRTATHEIGHCFGLRHIWGDTSSCTVNATDSYKDYCPDTPAAANENYDCNATYDSCSAAAGNDMTENYMDYTNDICMNTFTLNQKGRVLAVIQNSPRRNTLPTSPALQAPLLAQRFDLFDNVKLYPNPANDFVTINISEGLELPDSFDIYNAMGQLVNHTKVGSSTDLTANTSGLSKGVYFIKINKETATKTLPFIKK
ncbi:T9SS type A sorting domain-containing protein [Flavobacterium phycosphaerae]|uniref:T9SS type A sorting domain-containing protein n=1 Tax=Flavobacterium phycosphaerae TaxID=2697515 RepID=UPI00138A2487|nr:T9SS type A sorting domain-containing protein [Flavobacterium phycosphaerae]